MERAREKMTSGKRRGGGGTGHPHVMIENFFAKLDVEVICIKS